MGIDVLLFMLLVLSRNFSVAGIIGSPMRQHLIHSSVSTKDKLFINQLVSRSMCTFERFVSLPNFADI